MKILQETVTRFAESYADNRIAAKDILENI